MGIKDWATKKDMREAGLLGREGGVILGQLDNAKVSVNGGKFAQHKPSSLLVEPGIYNTLLVGPARSGKNVSSVIPTLLSYPDSVIVLDFRAENFYCTSGFRSMFSKIYRYAPTVDGGHHFNPMMEIRGEVDSFADANLMADILITPPDGKGHTNCFDIAALEFLTAAIIHCLTSDWPDKSLPGVASFLEQVNPEMPGDPQFIYKQMINGRHRSAEAHRQVMEGAEKQAKRSDKEGAGVLSTVKNALAIFKDTKIKENLSDSEFSLNEFETSNGPISLYLTIPNSDRDRIASLIKMVIRLASRKFSLWKPKASYEGILVLFILDGFDELGRCDEIYSNMGIHNGYGIHYFLIIQSLLRLSYIYGKDHSFLENCRNTIFFTPCDFESAERISGIIDLLAPEQIMKLPMDEMILLSRGRSPYRGKKCVYYEDKRFKKMAAVPPVSERNGNR